MKKIPALLLLVLVLPPGARMLAATPLWMQFSTPIRDAQGNSYFVGSTISDIVPVTTGAFQTKFNGGTCGSVTVGRQTSTVHCNHGFAIKISADGSRILYATYLEGTQDDLVTPAAVDSSGNLRLNVTTNSPDFPVTESIAGLSPQASQSSYSHAIVKLSADGGSLLLSARFGFPGYPDVSNGGACALLPDGKLLFSGTADGTAFPVTPGALLGPRSDASLDVFVFIWDPQTNTIVHSTLIGGSGQEKFSAIATDSAGNVYVTGYTGSNDFPFTKGAFNSLGTVTPPVNVFVAKLDSNLSTLEFSSLFGGSYHPIPNALAVDRSGNVYVDGWGSADMPVTPGAFETSYSSGWLVKLDGNTGARIFLTYLGDGTAEPGSMLTAPDGSVWVSGSTSSNTGLVVTADAEEPISPVVTSVSVPYLKHISADGSLQLYGTYLQPFLALVQPGVALESDSANITRVVDFNVPGPPPGSPVITAIVNAASLTQPGYIAPGEIVSIFGLSIGPDQPAVYQRDSTGHVPTNLNGLQVQINGFAAPILYASATQINAIVPFEAVPAPAGLHVTVGRFQILKPGSVALLTLFPGIVNSLPGIFQVSGAGLVLNQDGTVNGPNNLAKQGSTVSLFVTGLGSLTPAPVDGAFATGAAAKPTLPITVFAGAASSTSAYTPLDVGSVSYAGEAPGEIEGLQQINVQLPADAHFSSLYVSAGSGISNPVTFYEQ